MPTPRGWKRSCKSPGKNSDALLRLTPRSLAGPFHVPCRKQVSLHRGSIARGARNRDWLELQRRRDRRAVGRQARPNHGRRLSAGLGARRLWDLKPANVSPARQPREEPARRRGGDHDALDHRPPAIVAVELDGFITVPGTLTMRSCGVGAQLTGLGGAAQLLHGAGLDLAGALAADAEARADLVERARPAVRHHPIAQPHHLLLTLG